MTALKITLAGTPVPDPLGTLCAYAIGGTGKTVDVYDFATPGDPDVLTSEQVTTTRQIHSRISNAERDAMVEEAAKHQHLWKAVPQDARLVEADPAVQGGLYDNMTALYKSLTDLRGVKSAKASKVLMLKRRHLYPMLDSRVLALYRKAATDAARKYPERGYQRMYWAAIREDVIRNQESLTEIRLALTSMKGRSARLAELSDVRLLDILAWRL